MADIAVLPGVRANVPLAPYTTYKIGGPADYFVEPATTDQLIAAVQAANAASTPFFILGCGANILVSDKGFRGLVIHNTVANYRLDGNRLVAGSGAVIADLLEEAARHGLSGLEHFVGIPSTVGGALWQNLHFLAPDRQSTLFIGDILESAQILDPHGEVRTVGRDYFKFGYDDSTLHHESSIVLEATFRLAPKPEAEIRTQMAANMAWRIEKQPQLDEYPSCGSVFQKIEGVGAGRLIDEAGLKGTRIGNAEISKKHANYFINLGGATAAEVRALIELAHDRVLEKTGYGLKTEISFVGEW